MPPGMILSRGFASVLIRDELGAFRWADTWALERAVRAVPLSAFLPEVRRAFQYGRPFVLITPRYLAELDAQTRDDVLALLQRAGRFELSPAPAGSGATRPRGASVRIWTIPAATWDAFAAQFGGIAFDQTDCERILDHAAQIQEADREAARVEALLDRLRRRFLRAWDPWRGYRWRYIAKWIEVEAALGAIHPHDSELFAAAEARAWRALPDELLLWDSDQIAAFAREMARGSYGRILRL